MNPNDIYLSFILAFRDDNYGGKLVERTQNWINYLFINLGEFARECELVIVNWNPPSASREISKILDLNIVVNHLVITVPAHVHGRYSGSEERPMLDYVARQVGAQNARGKYLCIINQDIYPSDKIFSYIKNKKFEEGLFYRADRCDLDFNSKGITRIIKNGECHNVQTVHRRHKFNEPISLNLISGETKNLTPCSHTQEVENDSVEIGISYNEWKKHTRGIKNLSELKFTEFLSHTGLHTNASGDFIVAPTKILQEKKIIPENALMYMHSDSYMVINLWIAGLRQGLFTHPMHVFHLSHSREERITRGEIFNWHDNEIILKSILYGITEIKQESLWQQRELIFEVRAKTLN